MGVRVFVRADATGALAQSTAPPASPSASPSASASGSPAPAGSTAPAAGPAPTASPELTAKARAEFVAWQSGKIDQSRYIPEAKARFTPEFVADVAAKYLKPIGTLSAFTQIQKTTYQGSDIYVYRAAGDKSTINMVVSWNPSGLIQFIRFVPPQG